MTSPTNPDFDWVTARAKCSPATVFSRLLIEVKRDVEKRMEFLNPSEKAYSVTFAVQDTAGMFMVSRCSFFEVLARVTFTLRDYGIEVKSGGNTHLANLTLSNEGECQLKIGPEELSFWQFRKWALEPIFFEGARDE